MENQFSRISFGRKFLMQAGEIYSEEISSEIKQ